VNYKVCLDCAVGIDWESRVATALDEDAKICPQCGGRNLATAIRREPTYYLMRKQKRGKQMHHGRDLRAAQQKRKEKKKR
jgi:hypothetical protein